ncbi:cysteine protease, putative [Entamoeba invadens IP1]|uniref:Cysteine protease, putative n=1 Tax=Entamoeba invadens IP1 TaxID=370355 RepID=L7FKS0_ENTIV|nr:cysteine protease, putative [Entamoeba invadens IP1]ELP86037.1 cysteine protease, putative [Entamoeba invadens IP1]|eukprot:XP_004185383.1 cysteine protease, putative [Entamoeba invadens IP1]
MFLLLLLFTFSQADFDLTKTDFELFKEFEVKYNKKYSTPSQRLARLSIFKSSLEDVRRLNSKRKSPSDATFGINYFSDLTPLEVGLNPQKFIKTQRKHSTSKSDDLPILPTGDVIPDYLSYCGPYVQNNTDHPKIDFCGTPLDQMGCGCCYAAAIANHGQILYANMTYYKNNKDEAKIERLLFTPQRFIDTKYVLSSGFSNKRCCGGNSGIAIEGQPTYSLQKDYAFSDGTEESYNIQPPCTPRGDQNASVEIYLRNIEYQIFSVNQAGTHEQQVLAMKKIIHHYGSVLVAIMANATGIMSYKNGIFTFPQDVCQNLKIDHQVILVGYGKDAATGKDYFIARNTWGSWWGENGGFARISTENFCGMAQDDTRGYDSQNYIFYSGNCKIDPNCKTCNATDLLCTECKAGTDKDKRGVCVAPGQYDFQPVNPPITCISGCSSCTDTTTCNVCNTGKVLQKDKKACLDKCPSGQYADSNKLCNFCGVSTCETCAISPANKCDTCPTNKYLAVDKTSCLASCPNGQYPNANKQCTACTTANCATCDASNVCTACKTNFTKTSTNQCTATPCGDGKFGTLPNCGNCLANCKTCTNATICTVCTGTNKLSEDKKTCYATCPKGTYTSGTNCKKCTTTNCVACNNSNVCTECAANYQKTTSNQCEVKPTTCPSGQYGTAPNCQNCLTNCDKCVDGTTCDLCTGINKLSEDKTKCYSTCPNGTYVSGNYCKKCSTANCAICNANNVCTQCLTNFDKTASNQCVAQPCGDGEYGTKPNCNKCISNCQTCTDNIYCSLCAGEAKLQEDKKKCYTTCPSGTYATATYCKKCTTANCLECNNNNECSKCIDNFELSGTPPICTSKSGACGDGYYGEAGKCQKCSVSGCKRCSDGETCDMCNGIMNLEFNKKKCSNDCPTGYLADNQKCLKCDDKCNKCQALDVCDECNENFKFKVEGKCYNECPDHYFEENDMCNKCKNNYLTPCNTTECEKCTAPQNRNGVYKIFILIAMVVLLFL